MEVFEVFASLYLKGDALKKIEEFSALVEKSALNMTKLQEKLGMLTKGFTVLNTATSKENIELKVFNTEIGAAVLKTSALSKEVKSLSIGMKEVAVASRVAAGGVAKGAGFGAAGGFISGGTLAVGAAVGLGYAVHSGFESQKEYQKKEAQLKSLGLGPGYMKSVNNLVSSTNIAGVSKIDMLEAVVDAQMATRAGPGQFKEITAFAPELAKASMQSSLLFGGMSDKQKKDLIRFAEIKGGSDLNNQLVWLKTAVQMMLSSGGTIMPNKQLQFSQLTAGSMNLSPEAYLALEPVIQELQSRTATGLTTGYRAFNSSGSIPGFSKKAMEFWAKSGVFTAQFDKVGQPLGVKMSAANTALLSTDPDKFIRQVLLPALKLKGITDPQGVHDALAANLPRTFAQFTLTDIKNAGKVDRAREMGKHLQSGDALQNNVVNTAGFASQRFSASLSNVSLAFGRMSSPGVISGMNVLSSLLDKLAILFNYLGTIKPDSLAAKLNSPNANESLDIRKSLISQIFSSVGSHGSSNKNIQVNGNVYLDNQKVGKVVASNLSDKLHAAGTMSSSGAVNPSLSLPPVGLSNYGFQ